MIAFPLPFRYFFADTIFLSASESPFTGWVCVSPESQMNHELTNKRRNRGPVIVSRNGTGSILGVPFQELPCLNPTCCARVFSLAASQSSAVLCSLINSLRAEH